jgi:hypothetical protein
MKKEHLAKITFYIVIFMAGVWFSPKVKTGIGVLYNKIFSNPKNQAKDFEKYPKMLLVNRFFSEELVESKAQFYKEVNGFEDLNLLSKGIIKVPDFNDSLYSSISPLMFQDLGSSRFVLSYRIKSDTFLAFGYFFLGKDKTKSLQIIPGTGINQAYRMVNGSEPEGSILHLSSFNGSKYVYSDFNQNFNAVHANGKKLKSTLVVVDLLNKGKSKSNKCIIDNMAIAKYLKTKYNYNAISGMSQGAMYSLIVGCFSRPNLCIAASGFSIMFKDFFAGDAVTQFILPGSNSWLFELLRKKMTETSRTNYFLSYGKSEFDIYGYEFFSHTTERWLTPNRSIHFIYHLGGHTYPMQELNNILN